MTDKRPVERIDRIFFGTMAFIGSNVLIALPALLMKIGPDQVLPFSLLPTVLLGLWAARNVNKIDDWLKERT